MTISRRSLLAGLVPVAAALGVAACGGKDDPAVRISAAGSAVPATGAPTVRRAVSKSVEPPVLDLPREPVPQGGTFVVTLTGERIAVASVEFRNRLYPCLATGNTFFSILPVGQDIGATEQVAPGVYPVTVGYEIIGQPLPRAIEGGVTVISTDFPVEYLTFTPQVAALLTPSRMEEETALLKAAYGTFTPERLWTGAFRRPSAAEITDVYGSRRSYQGGPATGSHAGVDFGGKSGTPVLAAGDGRVVQAQMMPIRGNMVVLDHGGGLFTGYCHLLSFAVQPGQVVHAGDLVGATGATGLVTGPHLHWEVAAGGQQVDGMRWLAG